MVAILILTLLIVTARFKWFIERRMYRNYKIREIEELISYKYAEYDGDEEDQPGLKELREELREWKNEKEG